MTSNESKSFFMRKIFPIVGFVFGPILISIGIFIPGVMWKIVLIVFGSILLFSLYFLRKPSPRKSEELCSVCKGTGSINTTAYTEHSVKNCWSYQSKKETCGMCEGSGVMKEKP